MLLLFEWDSPLMSMYAACALALLRHASITRAPRAARSRAVSRPTPVLDPSKKNCRIRL